MNTCPSLSQQLCRHKFAAHMHVSAFITASWASCQPAYSQQQS
jgi:hypothetical protein